MNSKRTKTKTKSKSKRHMSNHMHEQNQIMRKGHVTKTNRVAREYNKKKSEHKQARQMFPKAASKSCKRGEIKRDGYYVIEHLGLSKDGKALEVNVHRVPPACIPSVLSRSSKKPKLITITDRDLLAKYGYHEIKNKSEISRHRALGKAIRDNKPLSVYRRLVAIATLNKNKDHELCEILRADAEWIKRQPEYIEHMASKKRVSKTRKTHKPRKSR